MRRGGTPRSANRDGATGGKGFAIFGPPVHVRGMELRPYEPDDRADLIRVCIATGDNGRDAARTFSHPELVAKYYLEPYLGYEASLCLTLADTAGPCGYVVGATDTRAFVRWFNAAWLPQLRLASRGLDVDPDARDAWLLELVRAEATIPSCVDAYPAHLHIDLLPRAQNRGWGRRMITAWTELAATRGACGVHLGVGVENIGALAFYERLGFRRLEEEGVVLGLRLRAARFSANDAERRG